MENRHSQTCMKSHDGKRRSQITNIPTTTLQLSYLCFSWLKTLVWAQNKSCIMKRLSVLTSLPYWVPHDLELFDDKRRADPWPSCLGAQTPRLLYLPSCTASILNSTSWLLQPNSRTHTPGQRRLWQSRPKHHRQGSLSRHQQKLARES